MSKLKTLVTGEMTVAEVVELYPPTGEILADWGLGCAMCSIGQIETLAEGILAHGFSLEDLHTLIEELNETANDWVEIGRKK